MTEAIKKHYWTALAVSVLLCTLVAIGAFCARTQPHTDEVWSYMLSNKYDSPFLYALCPGVGVEIENVDGFILSLQKYFNHWHDGKYYRDALTVQPGEQFAYGRVYHNQSLDVHPPLYYYLLHTICSFFPNQFSWWFAFSINLMFYIGSMVLIFVIGNALGMEKSRSLLASMFWGLSSAGIYEVCFLRMYMMMTFIMLCVTYLNILISRSFNVKYVAITYLLCTLGELTHYYAYIYIFFITLFCVIYLFNRREYKHGILYGLAILLSVATAVTFYPVFLKQMFSGIYGDYIANGYANIGLALSLFNMIHLVLQSYTGINILSLRHVLTSILIISYLLHLLALLHRALKQDSVSSSYFERLREIWHFVLRTDRHYLNTLFRKIGDSSWKLILFSLLTSSFVIANFSTSGMGVFTIRYMFAVLPLFSIFMVHYTEMLLFYIFANKKNRASYQLLVMSTLCAIGVFGSYLSSGESNFLHKNDSMASDYRRYFENSDIVLVDKTNYAQAFTPWLMNSNKVFPTGDINSYVSTILSNYKDTRLYLIVSSSLSNYGKPEIDCYLSTVVPGRYSYVGTCYCSTNNSNNYLFYQIKGK